ncbi:unnamed protein product, partial [Pylaiella littoralis]
RNEAPFQRLEILIRDWQCWKEQDDPMEKAPKKLHDEFLEYLDAMLAGGSTTDSAKIKACFRDLGCFGLPGPGEKVCCNSFDGKISDISDGFKKLLPYYIKTVILDQLTETSLPNTEE